MNHKEVELHKVVVLEDNEVSPVAPKPLAQEPPIEEAPENKKKAYLYALLTSVTFGFANYCSSDISIKVGILGIFPQVPALILTWLLYHSFTGFSQGRMQFMQDGKFSFKKLSAPFGRMILILMIHVTHIVTF
jgi:hypothetical protein